MGQLHERNAAFRSFPFKPCIFFGLPAQEYFMVGGGLEGNGCFSLMARAGWLHPG
jgi:hypothetical protein